MRVAHQPSDEWQIRVDESSVLTQDTEAVNVTREKLIVHQISSLVDFEKRCSEAVQVD